jgi:hypothetical protein
VDRHVATARRNKAALIWEGEPGDRRTLTYWDLYVFVQKFATFPKQFGVKKGDLVAIYMPLIPEVAIAMLACTRIGAIHSVVFGGSRPIPATANDMQRRRWHHRRRRPPPWRRGSLKRKPHRAIECRRSGACRRRQPGGGDGRC